MFSVPARCVKAVLEDAGISGLHHHWKLLICSTTVHRVEGSYVSNAARPRSELMEECDTEDKH